jgi:hypothetical protein
MSDTKASDEATTSAEALSVEGASVDLHQDPSTYSTAHSALLLTLCAHAWSVANKVPGVTFPVHLEIEFGGVRVCASISPAKG